MKFIAQPLLGGSNPGSVGHERIAALARAAEDSGFDGIAFEDHPAPPRQWFEGTGHQAFDPFAAMAFCAALTLRVRLMPMLVVVPYRNPLLLAKSIATVDVLSGGRLTICAGAGYLTPEFDALGVRFEERNAAFDESMELLRGAWANDTITYSGRHFSAVDQVSLPTVIQRPLPPLWIGGNSALSRERAVTYGHGWAPFLPSASSSSTINTRTAAMQTHSDLRAGIEDLYRRLEAAERDPKSVDVICTDLAYGLYADVDALPLARHLELLEELRGMGVTWFVTMIAVDDRVQAVEAIERYGSEVIRTCAS